MEIEQIDNDYFVDEAGRGLEKSWVYFDPEDGNVWFDCDRESNNSTPSDIRNDRVFRWRLPAYAQGHAAVAEVRRAKPLFGRLVDGWDGDEADVRMTDAARDAVYEIGRAMEDIECFSVCDAEQLVDDYDGSATTAAAIAEEISSYLCDDQRALGGIRAIEKAAREILEASND